MPDTGTPRWLRLFRDDRTGIAFLGGLAILRGISYLPTAADPYRQPAHWLEEITGPPAWAWVWIILVLLCLAATAVDRLVPAAVGGTVGIHAAWALSFLGVWVTGESARGWVSALGYAGVAFLFLWAFARGKRSEVTLHIRDDTDTP